MNCERNDNTDTINKESIPMGSGKSKPDKPSKKDGGRWSKTFGSHEEGTVCEAGTFDALAWRGCQIPRNSKVVFLKKIYPLFKKNQI